MQSTTFGEQAEENRTEELGDGVIGWLRKPASLDAIVLECWYAVVDGEYHGPMSAETLVEVLAEHVDDEDAPLWRGSCTKAWTTMREVPGLAAEVALARARREDEWTIHPVDPVRFATWPLDPEALLSSDDGEIDIGAWQPESATEAPIRAEWLAPVSSVDFVEPERTVPRRSWVAAAVGLGGLGVAAFASPFLVAAVRPAPAPTAPVARSSVVNVAPPSVSPVSAPIASVSPPPTARASAPSVAVVPRPSEHRSARPRHHRAAPAAPASLRVTAASSVAARPPEAYVPPREQLAREERAPRSMDELLLGAVSSHRQAAAEPTDNAGPHRVPTHAEAARALEAVARSVSVCTHVHEVAAVRVTFRGETGRASAAVVDGTFAGTTAGACISRAVREAHVAPFTQASFEYAHRFRL